MRLALSFLAAATAASLAPPAHAAPPPEGLPCTFHVWNGNTTDTWVGHLSGGPLVAPGSAVSIRCSIHAGNAVHSGPAVVEASSAPSPGVAHLAQLVSYQAPDGVTQSICTEATVDDTRWYWTGEVWTTDAAAVCPETVTTQLPPENVTDLYDCLIHYPGPGLYCLPLPWELVPPEVPPECVGMDPDCTDGVFCRVFRMLPDVPGVVEIEEDGDVHLAGEPFWDCPPYDEWQRS